MQNLLFLDLGLQGFLLFFKETLLLRQSDILERKECGPKHFQVFKNLFYPPPVLFLERKTFLACKFSLSKRNLNFAHESSFEKLLLFKWRVVYLVWQAGIVFFSKYRKILGSCCLTVLDSIVKILNIYTMLSCTHL